MSFSDHEVHSIIHRIFAKLDMAAPPYSTSKILTLYPDLKVSGRAMKGHAQLEVYTKPLPSGCKATIYYNEDGHASTQRFSIAHELAHWIFDLRHGKKIPDHDPCLDTGTRRKPMAERRADYFASELLVPLWVLDNMVDFEIYPNKDDADAMSERSQQVQRLASRFNVSMRCMKLRVLDLAYWRRQFRGR